jgi:NAD(P)H-hydrate epimerase
MATTGGVLAGTIAAMFGLGLTLEEGLSKRVFIHGLAGDLATADKGEEGSRPGISSKPFPTR